MEALNYTLKIHPAAEGGYWAEFPALPGCFTKGESLEEVTILAQEAIECHLAGFIRRGEPFPVEKRVKNRAFAFPISVRAPKSA